MYWVNYVSFYKSNMKRRKFCQNVIKYIMLLVFVFLFGFIVYNAQKVYVCTGTYVQCYHKFKFCEGLIRCGGEIKRMKYKEAKALNLKECNYCYHRNEYDPDFLPVEPEENHRNWL